MGSGEGQSGAEGEGERGRERQRPLCILANCLHSQRPPKWGDQDVSQNNTFSMGKKCGQTRMPIPILLRRNKPTWEYEKKYLPPRENAGKTEGKTISLKHFLSYGRECPETDRHPYWRARRGSLSDTEAGGNNAERAETVGKATTRDRDVIEVMIPTD